GARAEMYCRFVRVKPEVDTIPFYRAAGVARERRTVAFDIQTRSERNDARVDGDDTEAGRQTYRGRAGASVAVRIVGRGQHVERGVGETHGAVRCVFGKTRV